MPSDHEKSRLEDTLPGIWDRKVIKGTERHLSLFYFTAEGHWKRQRKVDGAVEEFFGQIFGTERSGKWILRGTDDEPVLHMRLHEMDLGIAGQVFLPFRKMWEAMERIDPIPFHRFSLVEIEDNDHIVMEGMNSIIDGIERWTRRND